MRKYKSMLLYFALINIKIRFKGTKLGVAWTAIEPTLTFVLLFVVFTTIRDQPKENFGVYLLTGVIIYHVFTRGTLGGLTSLRSNYSILESINIQKEFFPVVATLATCILLIVQLAIFFGLMPFFQFIPTWTIILLPIVIGLLMLLILGFSYILSIIHVYVRDIQPLWGITVHALFFITPIIWYVDDIKGNDLGNVLMSLHAVNPIGQIVELAHNIVVFNTIPPLSDWLYTVTFCFAIFLFGYYVFHKFDSKIVEVL
ncbi:MAG: hypothetical protein OEM28_06830 [Nitrosopumilus sp.]|nr:hypothetical protein [Nitrosopumilus sp.]